MSSYLDLIALNKDKNKRVCCSVAFILDTNGGRLRFNYWYWDYKEGKYIHQDNKLSFDLLIPENLDIIIQLLKLKDKHNYFFIHDSIMRGMNSLMEEYSFSLYDTWPKFKLIRNLL